MSSADTPGHVPSGPAAPRFQMRLPGFLLGDEQEVGLGEVIKRVTATMGLRPCGGCQQRAARLNRLVGFTRRS